MTQLTIKKVTTLPAIITPSTLYCINDSNNGSLTFYLTDKDGTSSYINEDSPDIGPVTLAIINAMRGQPNGLAELDSNGNLVQTVTSIDGQNIDLTHNGSPIWGSLSLPPNTLEVIGMTFDAAANSHKYKSFPDDMTGVAYMSFILPLDFMTGSDIELQLHLYPTHRHNVPMQAGQALFFLTSTNMLGHGQSSLRTEQNFLTKIMPVPSYNSINDMKIMVLTWDKISVPDLIPGSLVSITVIRNAYSSTDTYNGKLGLVGLQLNYIKDKLGTISTLPPFTS